jgi:hypothetical protein
MMRPIETDRVGGARNDDRQAGKGTASPLNARSQSSRRKTAVEMTSSGNHKTVSTGLGNLAQNARFPHSHEPITFSD